MLEHNNIFEIVSYQIYTAAKLETFRGAFTQVGADAGAEDKYYAVVRAHNAVTDKQYNEFRHVYAYRLMVGDDYVNATATAPFFEIGPLDTVEDSNQIDTYIQLV